VSNPCRSDTVTPPRVKLLLRDPLVRTSAIGKISYAAFNPTFKIRGASVVLHPLEIVSVPVDQLGEIVASLSDEGQSIVAALDELLTRAWK
jgi:toxin CcdB